ncbi:MAG: hypothetical protein JXA33_15890 [Anaerolineae bacterium]|nr:hypothetical protein [Anaerolineae bacterium]
MAQVKVYYDRVGNTLTVRLLFLVLILSAAGMSQPVPAERNELDGEMLISVNDAIEGDFPVHLPSDDILQSMGIAISPTVTMNTQGKACSYLLIRYYYEEAETLAMSMQISDGCVATFWRGYEIELSWAGEKAILVEEDKVTPIIIFYEPLQQFQYLIRSQEPLSKTLKLLESMK